MQMTFMNASVRRSVAAAVGGGPGLVLLARPSRSRAPRRRGPRPPRTRRPGPRRRGRGRAPRWRGRTPRRPRRRSPGSKPGKLPSCVAPAASAASRARAAQSASASSSTALVAARPTFPRSGTAISTVTSSIPVDWVGLLAAKRSISERSRVTSASAPGPACPAARSATSSVFTPRPPRRRGSARARCRATPASPGPGSPLPQSSSEISRQSSAEQTASQLPQNSGVTPA